MSWRMMIMVSRNRALMVAFWSALAVGLIHYIAHTYIAGLFPSMNPVLVVGIVVFLSVFLIGFFGMRSREK